MVVVVVVVVGVRVAVAAAAAAAAAVAVAVVVAGAGGGAGAGGRGGSGRTDTLHSNIRQQHLTLEHSWSWHTYQSALKPKGSYACLDSHSQYLR